jgi:hypothetical protein
MKFLKNTPERKTLPLRKRVPTSPLRKPFKPPKKP